MVESYLFSSKRFLFVFYFDRFISNKIYFVWFSYLFLFLTYRHFYWSFLLIISYFVVFFIMTLFLTRHLYWSFLLHISYFVGSFYYDIFLFLNPFFWFLIITFLL